MTKFLLRAGLAATAAAVALAAVHAQPPAAPVPAPPPKVIQWPGGWMKIDGQELILRNAAPGGGTTNIISGSGNGFGNRIVVGGGSGGGTTIIQNSRNGVGNQIVLDPNDWVFDVDQWLPPAARPALPPQPQPAAVPAPAVYAGKANAFWKVKGFSAELDCNIYWSAADKMWFRYQADGDKYTPLPTQPPAPKE